MNDTETIFQREVLEVLPLALRENDLNQAVIKPLKPTSNIHHRLAAVAERLVKAKEKNTATLLMMGAHVLRSGVQRYLIDMMQEGYISGLAVNGASVIHDWEFSYFGATTESVARYIRDGRFGLWQETGRINDVVTAAASNNEGLGEAVGRVIELEAPPWRDISILAAGYRLGIPVTVHVGIGYDILHEFPNCDGGAYGKTSYLDFLRFTRQLENLENGVLMNFGSAVMAPEIYLKGLSMVRNKARQQGKTISKFTTLVCDLVNLPENIAIETEKTSAMYYFRPWKTMLVRTVADGGEGFYVKGEHADTFPQLWTAIKQLDRGEA